MDAGSGATAARTLEPEEQTRYHGMRSWRVPASRLVQIETRRTA
jgi:hypothetical protein